MGLFQRFLPIGGLAYESGETSRQLPIAKTGDRMLRSLLVSSGQVLDFYSFFNLGGSHLLYHSGSLLR
jgi:hypothetical protein